MRFGGLVAIADLDLAVAENSIHSVIGPNGAGKTTVFNCITQNLRPTDRRGVVRRRAHRRTDAGSRRGGRDQPHLSEHPAVPQHHRAGQSAGRHASAPAFHLVGRGAAHAAHHARRTRGARGGAAPAALRRPARARRHAGAQSRLWRTAPAGDRPCARHQAEAAAARRADRGDEPARDLGDDGLHPAGARALRHHHSADRAPDARGDVDVGSGHGAGPRREDRRGRAGARAAGSGGDRGLSRQGRRW